MRTQGRVDAPNDGELEISVQRLASDLVHPSSCRVLLGLERLTEFGVVFSRAVFKFPSVCWDVVAGYGDIEGAVDEQRYVVWRAEADFAGWKSV